MLATTRDSDGLVQVLGFLWRYYEYRFVRARAILQSAYVPVIVFLMGALVAIVGLSLFQPMAMLNEHMAHFVTGGFLIHAHSRRGFVFIDVLMGMIIVSILGAILGGAAAMHQRSLKHLDATHCASHLAESALLSMQSGQPPRAAEKKSLAYS